MVGIPEMEKTGAKTEPRVALAVPVRKNMGSSCTSQPTNQAKYNCTGR